MITALALNPSIDRTLEIDSLNVGGLNRVRRQTDAAAGKGANAALAAAALGAAAECVGLMYPDGERMYRERFEAGGVGCAFVMCEGHVRVNQKIFDRARGEITELNQSGAPVDAGAIAAIEDMILRRGSDVLILTGSLPPGCPDDTYARLCRTARAAGTRVMIDADGERLSAGVRANPDLIKPNQYELEMLVGRKLSGTADILRAAKALVDGGVGVVTVSMSAEGALIVSAAGAWRARGLRVDVKSTVAAGDSMIAGLAVGLTRGMALPDALRLGAAAATARCATEPDRMFTREAVDALAERIVIEGLNV